MTKQELKSMQDRAFQMIEDLINAGDPIERWQRASYAIVKLFESYNNIYLFKLKRKDVLVDLSKII